MRDMERAARKQLTTDPELKRVLAAWGHGPEFVESLLSWGYRITLDPAPSSQKVGERTVEDVA